MKVLVLGGSGFIGSWAVRALLAEGHDIEILCRPTSDLWRLAGMQGLAVVRRLPAEWADEIRAAVPDVVLSLDWDGVGGADRNDSSVQAGNLARQSAVVLATREVGVQRFVGIGSQAEYGPVSGRIREEQETRPSSEYGRIKVEALGALKDLAAGSDLEWVWARIFSVYGPLQGNGWLFPSIADSIASNTPIKLTAGTQLWSYLFAADAGRALATLVSHPAARGIYNLASPVSDSLRVSIEAFGAAAGSTHLLEFGSMADAGPPLALEPDVSRLVSLGWEVTTSLATGMNLTAAWLSGAHADDPFATQRKLPERPATFSL